MANLLDTLTHDGRFDTFVSALQASNLSETLSETGPFTVFAPTEDGFAGLPDNMVDQMMSDLPRLMRLITYHIVPGQLTLEALAAHEHLETVEGGPVQVQRLDGKVFVNDALIIDPDERADNGVIHAVDAVLLPPTDDE